MSIDHRVCLDDIARAMKSNITLASYCKSGRGVIKLEYSPYGQEYFVVHRVEGEEIKHQYKSPEKAITAYNKIRL